MELEYIIQNKMIVLEYPTTSVFGAQMDTTFTLRTILWRWLYILLDKEEIAQTNLNWVEGDAVWLSTAIIILANHESSFGKAFNRANEEFKNY